MTSIKRNTALWLLLVSLVAFNTAEFFHNHDNSLSDNDAKCSACVLHSALQSADVSTQAVIITPLEFFALAVQANQTVIFTETPTSVSDRAPPLYHA